MNCHSTEVGGRTWGSAWVVVTGASRGLGAAICEGVAASLGPGSTILGLARSMEGLHKTALKIKEINPDVKFIPVAMNLSTISKVDLESVLKETFDLAQDPSPSRAVIFHNAGSLENLIYLRDMKDIAEIAPYFQFNICSVITLNALFMEVMSHHPNTPITVVNISSLCAVEAFKSWGLYCSAKAGRDMVFKVLATEEPKLRVLNYAPGPLDNEMQVVARSETMDEEVRSAFISMKKEEKLLPCSQSVQKLMVLLEKDEFKSGAHVDYYDV